MLKSCLGSLVVINTQIRYPDWPLLLLLHSELSHSDFCFVPQLMVSGHKVGASLSKLACVVRLAPSLLSFFPPCLPHY